MPAGLDGRIGKGYRGEFGDGGLRTVPAESDGRLGFGLCRQVIDRGLARVNEIRIDQRK